MTASARFLYDYSYSSDPANVSIGDTPKNHSRLDGLTTVGTQYRGIVDYEATGGATGRIGTTVVLINR